MHRAEKILWDLHPNQISIWTNILCLTNTDPSYNQSWKLTGWFWVSSDDVKSDIADPIFAFSIREETWIEHKSKGIKAFEDKAALLWTDSNHIMPFLICLSLTVNVRSLFSMQPGTLGQQQYDCQYQSNTNSNSYICVFSIIEIVNWLIRSLSVKRFAITFLVES